MGNQTIPVVIDTLQTPVVITANKEHFGTSYQVEDELNNTLREAVGYGNELRRNILNITNLRRNNASCPDGREHPIEEDGKW